MLKTGLSALFALLMCSQSLATPASYNSTTLKAAKSVDCIDKKVGGNAHCLTKEQHAQDHTEPRDSSPAQQSHESEFELEEKGEKELEDDKEEMNKDAKTSSLAIHSSIASGNSLAVTLCAGPIRDVPTPPPNC